MTTIRVSVTAEHIAAAEGLPVSDWWSSPVEQALGVLTGEAVDVDGSTDDGNVATIGQGEWTLVVDLPEAANAFLNARWDGGVAGEPFDFDLVMPEWIVSLAHGVRPQGAMAR